jgi:hypothetical protein
MRSVEKLADEEPSRHRFLAWVIRHPDGPSGRRLQRVEETGGYCWSTLKIVLDALRGETYPWDMDYGILRTPRVVLLPLYL